ncbi:MAG: thiamine transporter ATP-binding protein [Pseudomonadota bacterium]|jgi:thiamine transport system ATP-binding protein
MSPTLKADDLTIHYEGRAFRYSFSVTSPGLVAVTGPSGAGKSTLFQLLSGFATPETGTLRFDEQDLTDLPPGKRPVTLVFQDHNLFAHLDVFTNVALGVAPDLRLKTGQKEAVEAALDRVGLRGFSRRMPEALSGGEKQRVAFARALVRKRPLLLLDEPFASLDPDLRLSMGSLLLDMVRDGNMLALMISHDRAEVRRFADHVIAIEDGKVTFCGPTAAWHLPGEQSQLES